MSDYKLRLEKPVRYEKLADRQKYTGNDLFDRYFWVKVNALQNMNPLQLRDFGMRTTGVPELDAQLDKQEITSEWSIDMMFEKWRRGLTIRVLHYDDTVVIYDIIQAHLQAWATHLQRGVNVGGAPFRDLIELDAFSAVVYDKARTMFTKEERVTAIASNFANMSMLNFGNILKRRTERAVTVNPTDGVEVTTIGEKPVEPDHEVARTSYRSVFEQQAQSIQAWRAR